MSLSLTRHAQTRSQQRSLRPSDLELVWRLGTVTGRDRITLTNADVEQEIREHKAAIARLERLRNVTVVADADTVITAFHPRKSVNKAQSRQWRSQ